MALTTTVVSGPQVLRVSVVGVRGLQGPPGQDGAIGNANGAFLVNNRLAELNTEQARHDAQQNLGLGTADPLAYYILAKA